MDVRPPEDGEVRRAGAAPPQPELLRDAGLARQSLHLDQHQGTVDDGPGTPTAPGGMVLGLRVHAGPRPDPHRPILGVLLAVLCRRRPPGGRIVAGQLAPMPSRATGARLPVRIGVEAAPAPQPHQHRDPLAIQVAQLAAQLHRVVAGVEHAQRDRAVGRQAPEQGPDLRGGDGVRVVRRRHPAHVQRRRPAIVGEAHLREPPIRPAGDDRLAGRLPRGRVVVATPRAGFGIVARPDAGVHGVDRLPVVQGPPPHQLPQRRCVHRPDRQRIIEAAPPPAVDRRETQVRQRRHQPGHPRGVQQLEERIAPGPKRGIHGGPEATQAIERNGIEHAQSYGLARVLDPNTLDTTVRG